MYTIIYYTYIGILYIKAVSSLDQLLVPFCAARVPQAPYKQDGKQFIKIKQAPCNAINTFKQTFRERLASTTGGRLPS